MVNIAIFVSGGGTNCENIIKYFEGSEKVRIVLVVSNKANAGAIARAQRLGVPSVVVPKARFNDREVILPLLEEYSVDFIVLATSIRPCCRNTEAWVCMDTMSTKPSRRRVRKKPG